MAASGLKLNKFEYGFLQGDYEMWPRWGAALAVVMEFCQGRGYGSFGKPTDAGRRAMDEYELHHTTIDYKNV